jgi:hypothetical protein
LWMGRALGGPIWGKSSKASEWRVLGHQVTTLVMEVGQFICFENNWSWCYILLVTYKICLLWK